MVKKSTNTADSTEKLKQDHDVQEFSKEFRKLKKLVKRKELDPDQASVTLTKTLLAMSIEMLPKIEDSFHKGNGSRGVYGIVALTNQIRELSNDLRALNEREHLLERCMDEAVTPDLQVIAQAFSTEINFIKRQVKESVKDSKARNRTLGSLDKATEGFLSRLGLLQENLRNRLERILG